MKTNLLVLWIVFSICLISGAREWTDASGHYKFEGDLIAGDESLIILEKKNKDRDLVAIGVDQLSRDDQKYLDDMARKAAANPEMKTWTTRKGYQVRAAAVEYVKRDVTIQRRRGHAYVNDKRFANLPGVYRKVVPGVVSHFEKIELDEDSFEKWVAKLGGKKKTYSCEGVLLELENGDLYALPFFFFSDEDLQALKPGWEQWSDEKTSEEDRKAYSMNMRAQAMAQQKRQAAVKPIARMHFQMQGVQAGLTDLWEVALYPATVRGMPRVVVVPARDSRQATQAAMAKFPGYRAGAASKVNRRY